MSKSEGLSRRHFMKGSAAGAATLIWTQAGTPQDKGDAPAVLDKIEPSDTVNLGFIGIGVRGKQLMDYSGYPEAQRARGGRGGRGRGRGVRGGAAAAGQRKETDNLPRPLNLRCLGVCDLFDGNLRYGELAAGRGVTATKHYEDLLEDKNIDAVVIATSDHNHAPIGINAASAGKAIYTEKCFAHTYQRAKEYRDAVKEHDVILQLGHQTRSGSLMTRAREALNGIGANGTLGKVSLIETYTQRNTPNAAWVYKIDRSASPETVLWDRFLGDGPKRDFDADRFFRWRKYWDYGTGLAGDLLTHELDAVQNVTGLGIPDTATATGGIFYWKDGRETPDTLQTTFNYEKAELLILYTATLSNGFRREHMYFGHDATMDLAHGNVQVGIDADSDRYGELLDKGEWELKVDQGDEGEKLKEIRDNTTGTRQWTIDKGIYVDIIDGKEVNVTSLHMLNFVESIRAGDRNTNCNVDLAFQEAITAHMANLAYHRGRRVRWDAAREEIVNDG